MMFVIRVFRLWLGILIALYAVYLAINNTERMVLQLPPFVSHVSLPVYIVAAAFLVVGCALAIIFLGLDLAKQALTIHKLKKKLRQYESSDTGRFAADEMQEPSLLDIRPETHKETFK